jgi:hypothetical protein
MLMVVFAAVTVLLASGGVYCMFALTVLTPNLSARRAAPWPGPTPRKVCSVVRVA